METVYLLSGRTGLLGHNVTSLAGTGHDPGEEIAKTELPETSDVTESRTKPKAATPILVVSKMLTHYF